MPRSYALVPIHVKLWQLKLEARAYKQALLQAHGDQAIHELV